MNPLLVASLIVFGFLLGSIPCSVWLGRRFLRTDIRGLGDGNPGAWNVGRAGGLGWFLLAATLDAGKAFLPVWLARQPLAIRDPTLVAIALAPVLGHAFSPWLGGRGGKALAPCLGVWIALTRWHLPLVAVLTLLPVSRVLRPPGWAVLVSLGVMLAALVFWWWNPVHLAVWVTQLCLLAWTHRADLARRPRVGLRPSRSR